MNRERAAFEAGARMLGVAFGLSRRMDEISLIDLWNDYARSQISSDKDQICKGCKQPYSEHIHVGAYRVCPWPEDHSKPEIAVVGQK